MRDAVPASLVGSALDAVIGARALRSLLVLALLIAFGAVACGGESEVDPSLREYFQRLGDLTEELDAFLDGTDQALNESVRTAPSQEERIAAYRGYFVIRIDFAGYIVDQLESMDPPAEVADTHSEFAAAVANIRENFEGLLERTGGTDARMAMRELREGMNTSEFRAKCDSFESACLELQRIATASGIETGLACQEDRYR